MPNRFQRILRSLAFFAVPVVRWVMRRSVSTDPWERLDVQPRPVYHGAQHDENFREYLRASSSVTVSSMHEVEAWLRTATYMRAADSPFDWSTLPLAFEQSRAGNCLDHALWAWWKLIDLGVAADLAIGFSNVEDLAGGRHAWVVFHQDGTRYMLESVRKDHDRPMCVPVAEVAEKYFPEFGVDARGTRFTYGGALRTLDARLKRFDRGSTRGTV